MSLEEYRKDREADEKLRLQINSGVMWRLDQQDKRLEYLWKQGYFSGKSLQLRFSSLHRMRAIPQEEPLEEVW